MISPVNGRRPRVVTSSFEMYEARREEEVQRVQQAKARYDGEIASLRAYAERRNLVVAALLCATAIFILITEWPS